MKEELINHILKNKEMIYNKENIGNYIEMIEKRVYINNPFDRAIAILFELVIENEIDPLNVDLISFSNLYIKKVKNDSGINLFVSGKIILMAWKILRLQSEKILENMKKKEIEVEIPEWYGDDEIFYYTQRVINNEIPLEINIRRFPSVKVTIFDLINAFEEAKKEIERKEKRRDEKEENIKLTAPKEHIHKGDIEEDIKKLMARLGKLNGEAIPIKNLCMGGEDISSIFLPLLFLAKENKILIWQENFPFGEIYIRVKHGS